MAARLLLLLFLPCPAVLHAVPHRGRSIPGPAEENCPPCQESRCPVAPPRCAAGRARDRCGCCWQCANVEGQMCDPAGWGRQYGPCGEELRCQATANSQPKCVCRRPDSVCGTDRRTYRNICRLQEAARTRRRALLRMAHAGPCQEAPLLLGSPRDTVAVIGQSVILGCEVSAQPVAEMEWRKAGMDEALPGKHRHIIVQSRGGPQRHQVIGWLQIQHVKQRDAGLYTCQAWNTYGEVSGSARLHIISADSPLASEVAHHLVGVFDVSDDEDDSPREGPSGSHE